MTTRLFAAAVCAAALAAAPVLAQDAPASTAKNAPEQAATLSTQGTEPIMLGGLGGVPAGALVTIGIVAVGVGVAASNSGGGTSGTGTR